MRRTLPWLCFFFIGIGCDVRELSLPPAPQTPVNGISDSAAPIRVYFTQPGRPPSDPEDPAANLANYIRRAAKTIDVCAFELDNRVIVAALVDAVKRQVQVRLVTETDYLEEEGVQALKAAGVPVVDDGRDGALMHNKFMVFDGQSVWTGSMNFTENCAYRNNNHGVFIDDPRVAANYATKFAWMFEQRKFGGRPSPTAMIPHAKVVLRDGTPVENYFSTHDRIADRLIDELNRSRSDIHFLAFSFTHDGMGQAMLGRARLGVRVLGVFERSQAASRYSEYATLRSAGSPVQVYLDGNPRNMHHKVIIIDGHTTVAGSFNFSDGADKQNDENVIIIRHRGIAERFEEEFQRVLTEAERRNVSATSMN